jgi:nuclear protein localization protein 4 homolog
MKLTIRSFVGQKKINIEKIEELHEKILSLFKIQSYQLYSDPERTIPAPFESITDNSLLFISYNAEEMAVYKEEVKCTHSPDAVCSKCASLDPYDKRFKEGKKTKYLSKTSYLEMLKDQSKQQQTFDYSIKKCQDHSENAKCAKCMEKMITLIPQIYREIDYVEFDSGEHVELFIKNWRDSGRQQFGLLIGRFSDHSDVPDGRKAIVSGIWMIEQENYPDGVFPMKVPDQFVSKELDIVGMIYTDLFMKDQRLFSYKKSRNYILSGAELFFMHQIYAKTNKKSLLNVCVTMCENESICAEVYMLTEQFIALMDAKLLSMTTSPLYLETSREMSYNDINEYKKQVPVKAFPLVPLEYFYVTCETGKREDPIFSDFTVIEKPNLRKLSGYFNDCFEISKFKNFRLLMSLCNFLPIAGEIVDCIVLNDEQQFEKIQQRDEFVKFIAQLGEYRESRWNCSACTFLNESFATQCEICTTFKGSS